MCRPTHHAVVTKLVAFLFALVRADEELQAVSAQHLLSDVWPPVAAATPHLVGNAAVLRHGVAPQQVHNLGGYTVKHRYCKTPSFKGPILYMLSDIFFL